MMPKFPPTAPALAGALSIGEPFQIVNHWPTVIVQCQCDKKPVLVLIGPHNIVTCPACRNRYVITDDMQVGVGAMRPEGEIVQ